MRYVALDLVCRGHPEGEAPVLGRWWIESHHEQFSGAQVNEGPNSGVEVQTIGHADGATRLRYKLACPHCHNAPVFTAEKIDQALAAVYEQGAYAKVIRHRV